MDYSKILTKEDLGEPYVLLTEDLTLDDIIKIHNEFVGNCINFPWDNFEQHKPYNDLDSLLDKQKALKISKIYSGLNIYFPSFKTAYREKVQKAIAKEFDGGNFTELSRKYQYTERHIRTIVNSVRKNKCL